MKMELSLYFAICAVAVFVLTVIALRILIPKLKSIKMGQKILDIGPRWHKSKEGTPTMGGLSFISSSLIVGVAVLVFAFATDAKLEWQKLLICLGFAFLNGVIGFLDDYTKFFKKTAHFYSFLVFRSVWALFLLILTGTCGIFAAGVPGRSE